MTVHDDITAGRLRWASRPRLGSNVNEDRIGMTDNAVWVLDGAGTPTGVASCCDKDACWYVEHLDAAITAELQRNGPIELTHALARAISQVHQQHATDCPDPGSRRGPSSTVAMARRDGSWIHVLVLGDSTIVLDHGTHATTMRDTRLATVAPELRREIRTAIAAGHGYADVAHNRRRQQLVRAERLSRNRVDGYWIAADDPAAARHALTARHPITDTPPSVRRLALMTDGAHRATSILHLYDSDRDLLAAAIQHGPQRCIDELRGAEADDPDGRRYPRTKRTDDASLIVWDLAPVA